MSSSIEPGLVDDARSARVDKIEPGLIWVLREIFFLFNNVVVG